MNAFSNAINRRKVVDDAELGASAKLITNSSILKAVRLVKEGRVYDLGIERFHGMPLPAMHPPLEIITYRSIQGMQNQGDQTWITGDKNKAKFGFTSEMVLTCLHTGTHLDTLSHANTGQKHAWYGGYSADEYVGDFGTLKSDASTLPPLIARGVLIDVAREHDVEVLPGGSAISSSDLTKALEIQNIKINSGDIVLIRTGYMSQWPDKEKLALSSGSGITLEAAHWLASNNVLAVGTDTEAVEQFPSTDPDNPHPVHSFLLVENGIFMIECLDLEGLAKDQQYEFLFVGLPVKFRGGTAGLLDPVAVV